MAKITSLVNTLTRDLDAMADTTGTSRYKRALNARAVAGLDHSIADQAVATGQDDAAFTPGTDGVVAAGFVLDDAATDLVDEGDIGAARMTARRLALAVLADPTTDTQRLAIGSNGAARVEGVAGGVALPTDPAPNVDVTLLASAARTATLSSADQTNRGGHGIHVVLDVTVPGTGSITLKIEGKDAVSGKYYTILEGVAVTTASTNLYKVFPAATPAANAVANDMLPRTWRVTVTHNNANSITYSVGASVVV